MTEKLMPTSTDNDRVSGISRMFHMVSNVPIVTLLLLEVASLLIDESALGRSNWLATFFVWVNNLTSFPAEHAKLAADPFHTKLMLSVSILLTPMLAILFVPRIATSERKVWYRHWDTVPRVKLILLAFFLFILYPVLYIGFFSPGDPGFCPGCTTKSLIGLFGIYGFLMPFSIAYLLAGHFYMFIYIFAHLNIRRIK